MCQAIFDVIHVLWLNFQISHFSHYTLMWPGAEIGTVSAEHRYY